MTGIEQKAQSLFNEVLTERGATHRNIDRNFSSLEALCRAIEQHEATKRELADFKQKVSDAVEETLVGLENNRHPQAVAIASLELHQFIIPALKPDPLLAALLELELSSDLQESQHDAIEIRKALDAAGFEIREKNDD